MENDELKFIIRALDYFEVNTAEHNNEIIDEELSNLIGVNFYPSIFREDIKPMINTLEIALGQLKEIQEKNTDENVEYIRL